MRCSGARLACAVRVRYEALLARGALRPDDAQSAVVARLSRLQGDLVAHAAAVQAHAQAAAAFAAEREARLAAALAAERSATAARVAASPPPLRGWFAGLMSAPAPAAGDGIDAAALARRIDDELGEPPAPPAPPRGLFIYGGVGVGKTLLMDLFCEAATEALGPQATRRIHFNAFSLRVHQQLHRLSPAPGSAAPDARAAVLAARRRRNQAAAGCSVSNAAVFADVAEAVLPGVSSGVLCFDEYEVRDAFTAVALKGVFEALLARGVAVVLTSNRAPTGMSPGAAQQRELYDAFAATLAARCEAVAVDTRRDYREEAAQASPLHLAKLSDETKRLDALHAACVAAGGGSAPAPETVPVAFGRRLVVPLASGAVARASFDTLCAAPVGAADFIALAERFPVLFVDDVPRLSSSAADAARRFITLVDELYNARCVLAHTAAAPPQALFAGAGDDVALVDLEALQFEGEAENARSRRDVARDAGVAPVAATPAAMAGAVAALSGAAERFAFARAASRLAEMNTAEWVRRSRAPQPLKDVLLAEPH
jgi:cell division protein ZapE